MRRQIGVLFLGFMLLVSFAVGPFLINQVSAQSDNSACVTVCNARIHLERPNSLVFYVGEIICVNPGIVLEQLFRQGAVEIDGALIVPGTTCCAFTVMGDGTIVDGQVD